MSFLCSRVSGPHRAGWSQQCCVLVRDIIISILAIIRQMLTEIMLFQAGRHTSSDPKLMNNGREGRREGVMDSGAAGQHVTCVVMIWCWRDDSRAVTPRGEESCKLEPGGQGQWFLNVCTLWHQNNASYIKDTWQLSVQWTNEQTNKHVFFENLV